MNTWNLASLLQKSLLVPLEKRNLGTNERIISSAIGAFLCTSGMRRLGKGGFCLGVLPSSYFFWRAATGYCPVSDYFGWKTVGGTDSFMMRQSVVINRSPEEVYKVWRDFEKLPDYIKHLKSVKKTDENKFEWKAEFKKQEFTWNAEIVEDIPNKRITWKSIDPKDVENYGTIEFQELPVTGVTQMRFLMIYQPAKTELGSVIAQVLTPLFRQRVKDDIRSFRDQMNVMTDPH